MRTAALVVLVLSSCSHSKSPEPRRTVAGPAPWDAESARYLRRVADIMDEAGDDCVRLVAGLKTLEDESKTLAKLLVEADRQLKDHVLEAGTRSRFVAHAGLLDRCEAEKTPELADTLTATLFVVEPLKGDRSQSAFRDLFTPH